MKRNVRKKRNASLIPRPPWSRSNTLTRLRSAKVSVTSHTIEGINTTNGKMGSAPARTHGKPHVTNKPTSGLKRGSEFLNPATKERATSNIKPGSTDNIDALVEVKNSEEIPLCKLANASRFAPAIFSKMRPIDEIQKRLHPPGCQRSLTSLRQPSIQQIGTTVITKGLNPQEKSPPNTKAIHGAHRWGCPAKNTNPKTRQLANGTVAGTLDHARKVG
ncbi:MAG: hypothetical protein CBC13_01585 [Planctomycetia bacterium TMED53]|nr:MAG: hypothetical protein CBC13_01585 [Planctomycetia bacterium TMED53]